MSQPPSVLIVEPSADEREVLRTVLARRGLRIWEATAVEQGLALAREHHPDVIVLDAEEHDGDEVEARFSAASTGERSRLIVLGRMRAGRAAPGTQAIAKPYHFAPLVHKIEQLAAKAA
jgi:Response regulator containing CheY-like receiver, AAA-type ATPase, and DNA-binding domains